MAPLALTVLKAWNVSCPLSKQKLVFPTKTGEVIAGSNLHRQCWRPLLRDIGLVDLKVDAETKEEIEKPRYTFHCLRHTAASLFIEHGWTPKKLMTVMGHSSIQMTFDLYGHLWKTPEDDAKAMAEIQARYGVIATQRQHETNKHLKELASQRNHNPRVGGSSPSSATNDFNDLARKCQ